MEIRITDRLLSFDESSVRLARDYMSRAVVVRFLRVWTFRLADMRDGDVVYLPFSIDDECVEAFEAKQSSERLFLRVVALDGLAFVPEVDPLTEEEIERDRPVLQRRDEDILVCERRQLLDAVARAIAAA